eukprot:g16363.t1
MEESQRLKGLLTKEGDDFAATGGVRTAAVAGVRGLSANNINRSGLAPNNINCSDTSAAPAAAALVSKAAAPAPAVTLTTPGAAAFAANGSCGGVAESEDSMLLFANRWKSYAMKSHKKILEEWKNAAEELQEPLFSQLALAIEADPDPAPPAVVEPDDAPGLGEEAVSGNQCGGVPSTSEDYNFDQEFIPALPYEPDVRTLMQRPSASANANTTMNNFASCATSSGEGERTQPQHQPPPGPSPASVAPSDLPNQAMMMSECEYRDKTPKNELQLHHHDQRTSTPSELHHEEEDQEDERKASPLSARDSGLGLATVDVGQPQLGREAHQTPLQYQCQLRQPPHYSKDELWFHCHCSYQSTSKNRRCGLRRWPTYYKQSCGAAVSRETMVAAGDCQRGLRRGQRWYVAKCCAPALLTKSGPPAIKVVGADLLVAILERQPWGSDPHFGANTRAALKERNKRSGGDLGPHTIRLQVNADRQHQQRPRVNPGARAHAQLTKIVNAFARYNLLQRGSGDVLHLRPMSLCIAGKRKNDFDSDWEALWNSYRQRFCWMAAFVNRYKGGTRHAACACHRDDNDAWSLMWVGGHFSGGAFLYEDRGCTSNGNQEGNSGQAAVDLGEGVRGRKYPLHDQATVYHGRGKHGAEEVKKGVRYSIVFTIPDLMAEKEGRRKAMDVVEAATARAYGFQLPKYVEVKGDDLERPKGDATWKDQKSSFRQEFF